MQGKAESADLEATASYPEGLAKIINEDDCTKQQIFDVDGTAFCWEKMHSSTYIAGEEKSMSGTRASKDRLALVVLILLVT